MPALGVPVEIRRTSRLSRFQFYLGLSDALFCRAQSDNDHLEELARAFAYDVLNLAVLAGRLLWYEGVTPEVWRSHDLIDVGVDTEAYYVMLQCACDIMADVVSTLGTKKGQAPWESFHKLNQWALKNPIRLASEYQIVAARLPWFDNINQKRTEVVHRGKRPFTFTDRVTFNWGRLIPSIKELTAAMLDFSEQLGRIVLPEAERERFSEKRVIDGVYVPALDHLLNRYHVPTKSPELKMAAQCLLRCGGYVEAAQIGYPTGFWWNLLFTIFSALGVAPFAANIPVNADNTVDSCAFMFSSGGTSFGFISYDNGHSGSAWLDGVTKYGEHVQAAHQVERIAIVVRTFGGASSQDLLERKIPVIIGNAHSEAADTFLKRVAKTSLRGS